MKKIIVLLSICILFVTGCQIVKLDSSDIEKNLDVLLSKKVNYYNVYSEGYKYYLPKGITFLDKDDYNAILKDNNSNKYYLYIDVISYYHKIENDYKENEKCYYSKKLNYNNKDGYIQVDEVDSNYFVQFVFNYAKMEAYVDKDDLIDSIQYMSSILSSVKYNRKVLESIIGEKILDYKEENYTLFKADSSKESFLDVVEREETERYKKDLEDEKIDLDN